MSSIEAAPALTKTGSATDLALALFDEVIAPAAAEGRGKYLSLSVEREQASYFLQPATKCVTPSDFDFPGGGHTDGLIDALVAYWTEQGDVRLLRAGPRLKEIIAALQNESAKSDSDVDPYCYTMF